MPGDIYERVRSGDPLSIRAGTWNALMSDAERRLSLPPSSPWNVPGRRPDLVNIEPNVDLPWYGVATLSGVAWPPESDQDAFQQDGLLFTAQAPAVDQRPVVALEPIDAGNVGVAVFAGWVHAQVFIRDATHTRARIRELDPEKLESAADGEISIVWKPVATGIHWAVVELPPHTRPTTMILGKTTDAVLPTQTTFDLYGVDALTGAWELTTAESVNNVFRWELEADKYVAALLANDGQLYAMQAEC